MRPLADRLADRELIQRGDLTHAWRARDRVLDRPVFVKLLHPALSKDAEIRARFEREARAVARLDHPNLVRIYEYGEDPDEGLYMLLEWMEGQTLTARLAAAGTLGGADWLQLARELLAGLAALHSVGILHRDLKPDNILIRQTDEGQSYKIADFSLAALRDAPKLTHHEAIVGTPAYMAPEQAAGGVPGERSDLFALGVILYEAATGVNPFLAASMLETMKHVRELEPSFTHPAILALPEKGRALLPLLLKKEAGDRPASARAALGLLGEKYLPPHVRPRSRRRDLVFLGMAAVVIAAWALFVFEPHKETPSAITPPLTEDTLSPRTASPGTLADSAIQRTARVSEPEFRAAPPSQIREPERTPPQETAQSTQEMPTLAETVTALPDSVDLYLTTEPWADVYAGGVKLGTTPLAAPLRVAAGSQRLILRNPAFPPVELPLELTQPATRLEIPLARQTVRVQAHVMPWGELYVDGEHVGTTPLEHPLYVSPGTHTIRISHPQLSALEQEFTAGKGDGITVRADLAQGRLAILPRNGDTP